MYRLGRRKKSLRRRIFFWTVIILLLIGALFLAVIEIRQWLKPHNSIKQSAAIVHQINFNVPTKQYNEPDFSISLPASWTLLPRPAGPYKSFTWQSPDRGAGGQLIEVYEDVIPTNFAVNRLLVVESAGSQLSLPQGQASDNCANFTDNANANRQGGGIYAKWQGIAFLCDTANQERDVIGTSSSDGINTVILKSPSTGANHQFFFTYTDFAINPDYTVFYNALTSFRMQ